MFCSLKNLKEANFCQIAGGAKKLNTLSPHLTEEVARQCGENSLKVTRIVKKGHVYFSKEYTRMIKRNGYVVLLSNGKVGEIEFFIWNKGSGNTFLVYKEVEPDQEKPFFYDDAGCHVLRMKPQRYVPYIYITNNFTEFWLSEVELPSNPKKL